MSETVPALVKAFVEGVPEAVREAYAAYGELPAVLEEFYSLGRRSWPGLGLAPTVYASFLAARIGPSELPSETLPVLHAADLYLSCATAQGDSMAIEMFESSFRSEIDRSVARMAGDAVRGDDFKQELRQKLFLGTPDAPAKITEYSGRGSLRRWVRVCARRTYIDLMRTHRREAQMLVGDDQLLESESADELDPEVFYTRRRYHDAFCQAFEHALAGLDRRQRTLLRHHFVHRLRLDEIGSMYRVHPATVSRWIAQVRAKVLEATRQELRAELSVGDAELDSIVEIAQGDVDINVAHMLKASA